MKKFFTTLALLISLILTSFQDKKYHLNGHELRLSVGIYFDHSQKLEEEKSREALHILLQYLNEKTMITAFRIEGNYDQHREEKENLKISKYRSRQVAEWLIEQGIDCHRLVCVGFGSRKPQADKSTPEGSAANNQLRYFNAALLKKAIGGMPLDGGGESVSLSCP